MVLDSGPCPATIKVRVQHRCAMSREGQLRAAQLRKQDVANGLPEGGLTDHHSMLDWLAGGARMRVPSEDAMVNP
jgi:hypothetical protein